MCARKLEIPSALKLLQNYQCISSSSACFCLMHTGSQMSCYGKQICKHVITPKESAETEVWTANYGSPEGSMKSYPSWAVGVGGEGGGGKCA